MRYFNEEIAFSIVFGSRGDEESASNEHYDLEGTNPFDTIPVATFFDDNPREPETNVKTEYFYVCNFDNTSGVIPIARQKCYLLFSIRWDPGFLVWHRYYWLACDGASSHNEAAEWLMKQVTIIDRTNLPDIDHLKSISTQQAFLLTALSWLSIAVFGSLPFFFSELNLSITETGVISAAVPVKKQPTKLDISFGLIFLSIILIPFDFAISITHLLVMPSKNESGIGVCKAPALSLKKIFAPVASAMFPS